MTTELEDRINSLEKALSEKNTTAQNHRRISKTSLLIAVSVIALSSFALLMYLQVHESQQALVTLPDEIVSQAKFPVYYFDEEIPNGYSLDEKSVVYSADTLLFNLVKDGQSISISQQSLPPTLSADQYPNAETVTGADGKALVTFNGTTPLGALFAEADSKNDQSLILVRGSDSTSKEEIQTVLRQLREIKQP